MWFYTPRAFILMGKLFIKQIRNINLNRFSMMNEETGFYNRKSGV